MHKQKSQGGFTLLEVSLVLLIGGVLIGAFSAALLAYVKQTDLKTSKYRMEEVHNAIEQFLGLYNRYPCPANMNAAVDTAGYGVENCAMAPASGVLTGTVPTRTLNLSDDFMKDAWQSRILYAVTVAQTNVGSYTQNGGTISVTDSGTPPNSVINPPNSGHYILVSHGQNREGSFVSDSGVAYTTCASVTDPVDQENCDGDNRFIRSLVQGDDLLYVKGQTIPTDVIPPGGILAFNLATCPPGWSEFTQAGGRVILGAGTVAAETHTEGAGINQRSWLSPARTYARGQLGGWLTWVMSVEEMPAHRHSIAMGANIYQSLSSGGSPGASYDGATGAISQVTGDTGNSVPMENTPPYIALLYCVKS